MKINAFFRGHIKLYYHELSKSYHAKNIHILLLNVALNFSLVPHYRLNFKFKKIRYQTAPFLTGHPVINSGNREIWGNRKSYKISNISERGILTG